MFEDRHTHGYRKAYNDQARKVARNPKAAKATADRIARDIKAGKFPAGEKFTAARARMQACLDELND